MPLPNQRPLRILKPSECRSNLWPNQASRKCKMTSDKGGLRALTSRHNGNDQTKRVSRALKIADTNKGAENRQPSQLNIAYNASNVSHFNRLGKSDSNHSQIGVCCSVTQFLELTASHLRRSADGPFWLSKRLITWPLCRNYSPKLLHAFTVVINYLFICHYPAIWQTRWWGCITIILEEKTLFHLLFYTQTLSLDVCCKQFVCWFSCWESSQEPLEENTFWAVVVDQIEWGVAQFSLQSA